MYTALLALVISIRGYVVPLAASQQQQSATNVTTHQWVNCAMGKRNCINVTNKHQPIFNQYLMQCFR